MARTSRAYGCSSDVDIVVKGLVDSCKTQKHSLVTAQSVYARYINF